MRRKARGSALGIAMAAVFALLSLPVPTVYGQSLREAASLVGRHPAQMAGNPAIRDAITRAVGDRVASEILDRLQGVGSEASIVAGRWLIGQTCQPQDCGDNGTFIAFDIETGQVFIGLLRDGVTEILTPSQWPSDIASAVRQWNPDAITVVAFGPPTPASQPPARGAPSGPVATNVRATDLGPSFDCTRARDSLALVICSSSATRLADLAMVQAYQALRHQVGESGGRALRAEAVEFSTAVASRCGLPAVPAFDPRPYEQCVLAAYEAHRRVWASRLTSAPAVEEARRALPQHIALQRRLREAGALPEAATVDGVYGPATRTAIIGWQQNAFRVPTGFLSDADAAALAPRPSAPPTIREPQVTLQDAPSRNPPPASPTVPPGSDASLAELFLTDGNRRVQVRPWRSVADQAGGRYLIAETTVHSGRDIDSYSLSARCAPPTREWPIPELRMSMTLGRAGQVVPLRKNQIGRLTVSSFLDDGQQYNTETISVSVDRPSPSSPLEFYSPWNIALAGIVTGYRSSIRNIQIQLLDRRYFFSGQNSQILERLQNECLAAAESGTRASTRPPSPHAPQPNSAAQFTGATEIPERFRGTWGASCASPIVDIGAATIRILGLRDPAMPILRVESNDGLLHVFVPSGRITYAYEGEMLRGISVSVGGREIPQANAAMRRCITSPPPAAATQAAPPPSNLPPAPITSAAPPVPASPSAPATQQGTAVQGTGSPSVVEQKPWRFNETARNNAFTITMVDTGSEIEPSRMTVYCQPYRDVPAGQIAVVRVTMFSVPSSLIDGQPMQPLVSVRFDDGTEWRGQWLSWLSNGRRIQLTPNEPRDHHIVVGLRDADALIERIARARSVTIRIGSEERSFTTEGFAAVASMAARCRMPR